MTSSLSNPKGQHISIMDNASPVIRWTIANKPEWLRKALKSTGNMMRKEIQAGIRSGAPGGVPYAKFFDYRIRAVLDSRERRLTRRKYQPLGKLWRAVKYKYCGAGPAGSSQYVVVGWTSDSAVRLGKMMEEGFTRNVTPKVRARFDAAFARLGLKTRLTKDTLTTPARKTIGPMRAVLAPKLGPYVANKFMYYLKYGAPDSRWGGRRYNVKGVF